MSIVCDDRMGYTIPTDDVVEDEFGNLFVSYVCEGDGFDPLSEILSGSDNEFVAIGRGRMNFSHEVESPFCEGP